MMHYDALMRTTIDLPEDLHRVLTAVARDQGRTLSRAVAAVLRQTLMPEEPVRIDIEARTGLPVVRLGRVVTQEDVRSLEDEA